ncbi:MAG: N-acetylmuramoyl-L-alanine amidase [Gemmatimonadetes bacterium]|nr:N-acetylmuramoyl-L-alanine amidase [Gemmatimonadota bacterium]
MSRRARLRLLAVLTLAVGAGAGAPPGDVIRVKGVSGDTVLRLAPSASGGLVPADVMARLLGGVLDSLGDGRWRLGLYGTTLELREGLPFVTYNGFALPLLESTRLIDGAPHVALQLFSEIIPRFGIGILWDRSRAEVRLFQGIAKRSVPVGSVAPDPVDVPVPVAPARNGAASVAAGGAGAVPAAVGRVSAPVPAGLSRRYTVVVDAGHGGRDPGMRGAVVGGRALSEARITLAVARRLERLLEAKGMRVIMTRTADTLIALYDRGPIANRAEGDLFLSVHVNSANPRWKNPTSARGFETYYLSTARTEDEQHVEAMENEVVRFETETARPAQDALSFILNDLARNEHLRESSDLATVVQQKLAGFHPGPSRGVKQAGFAVLSTAYMPAVLVELGFGSNPEDARWMSSDRGQEEAASAIADAAFEYLQHYDRRKRGAQR